MRLSIVTVLFFGTISFGQSIDREAFEKSTIKRLSQLNHIKLDALMTRVGKGAPKGFYNCLCSRHSYFKTTNMGLSYHPEKARYSPICNQLGAPCMAHGYGCTRYAFPHESEIWSYCMGKNKYEDNTTMVDAIYDEMENIHAVQKVNELQRYNGILSTVNNYNEKLDRYLELLRLRGFPVDRIIKMNKMMRKHIIQLETPGELPGFLETLGFSSSEKGNNRSLEKWREGMLKRYDKKFLKLLKAGDTTEITKYIKKYSRAMSHYDQAMQFEAEGAIDQISANQTLVKDILESVPYTGEATDFLALVGYLGEKAGLTDSRNWTLNGDQVVALDAFLRFAGNAGPTAFEQFLKRSPSAQLLVRKLSDMAGNFGHSTKNVLKGMLGDYAPKAQKGYKEIVEILTKERKLFSRGVELDVNKARNIFAASDNGAAAIARNADDITDAKKLIDQISTTGTGTKEYKKLIIELQQNKTAQRLINADNISDNVRKNVNKKIKKWYKQVDHESAKDMKKLIMTTDNSSLDDIAKKLNLDPADARKFRDDAIEFARKNNMDLKDVRIKPLSITNKRPGTIKKISHGRDRDVTQQFQKLDKHGNTLAAVDINHKVSERVYEKNFYQNLHSGKLPDNPKEIHKWVHENMDQTVTSKWHPEAYNVGEVSLDDFLDKGIKPTITRVEDVADTVTFKSTVWFDRARKSTKSIDAARNTAEGMRQATKQWKDLIMSRANQYGLKPYNIPSKLDESMKIFKQVADGKIATEEGEYILRTVLKTDKESAVRQMGSFFEGMEKTAGRAYRAVEGKKIEEAVKVIYKSAGTGYADKTLTMLNDALKNGKIAGSKFLDLRTQILSKKMKMFPSPVVAIKWAKSAYTRRLISKSEYLLITGEQPD